MNALAILAVCAWAAIAQEPADKRMSIPDPDAGELRITPGFIGGNVPPDNVGLIRDLVYGRSGGRDLRLDLYLPQNIEGKAVPVVLWVHGGAWREGSKENPPAVFLTTAGYAVASVNYRLSSEALFPAQIEDVKAAVRWLRASAAKYRLNPDRVGAWGSSAGGHLVALLGTSGGVAQLEGTGGNPEYSSRIQAVVDFFGPTDLLRMDDFPGAMVHNAPDSPESQLIGGPIQENPDRASRANPIRYVSEDDPPFLIAHGDRDPLVPLNQSELLLAALTKAGVPARLEVISGAGHGFRGPKIEQMVQQFFDETLKKDGN